MRPTEALREEHRVIERALRAMEIAAERLDLGQEIPKEVLEKIVDFTQGFADRCHHHKEEGVLFPYMEERGLPRDMGPIGVMLEEHDIGRGHMKGLKEAVDQGKPEVFVAHAQAYILLLKDHIFKEDNILFPMAERMMGEEEAESLMEEFERTEQEHGLSHQEYLDMVAEVEKALGLPSAP